MARTNQEITEQEVKHYVAFCQKHHIALEGEQGKATGENFRRYFLDTWKQDITPATLELALPELHKANQVSFLNLSEVEFDRLSSEMSPEQRATILRFLPYYGFSTENSDDMVNFNIVGNWFVSKGQPITFENLTRLIGNVQNTPDGYNLRWKKHLQDSEKEELRLKEEEKQRREQWRKEHPEEKTNPSFTDPKLESWKRMLQRPLQPGDVGYEDPGAKQQTADDLNKHYQVRAEALVNSIQSNVDRAEAKQILAKAQAWGWQIVFNMVNQYVERRKVERSMAGRMG